MDFLSATWLLAAGDEKAASPGLEQFLAVAPFIAIGIFFYLFLLRPQRKEQSSRDAMLAALKKNDKVQTVGGIIGSVANISQDGKEVTLKIDDNTRIKFVRTSIQRVIASEGDAEKPAETK